MLPALSSPRLGRLAGSRAATAPDAGQQRCDLCGAVLAPDHRHLLDLPGDALLCACGACAVLFDDQAAGGRHYRLLPRRRVRLAGLRLDNALWAGLGVPVALAFFTHDSRCDEVVARYPSAAGALRATVPADSWQRLVAANPVLRGQHSDVEALVVNRSRGAADHWLLPLDECYRLTALLRAHWTGFAGGTEVWHRISAFFAELEEVR